MRDVVKTNVKRRQSSKRQHRRKRLNPVYFLLVVVLVIGIGAALSMTLFFNVTDIVVDNETDAANEEIVRLSGIQYQDNLVRLDTKAAEKAIADAVVYAEKVTVKKQFPSTVQITVEKAVPVANISCSYGYLLVSSSGKILEMLKDDSPREGLLLVTGYNPAVSTPGEPIQSEDQRLDSALRTMTAAVAECDSDRIVSVDLRDQSDILVEIGEHVTYHMGNSSDAVYKLRLALKAEEEVNPQKKYRFTMIGNNQISVIPEDQAGETTAVSADTTASETTETTATLP
ncbi:MAG: FtsQ-type POTRA domain-containing protein [Oscillospiraceae bacterium]|nr:FtsQ-type POTRA domain-containing protein [Oscillospiraceae bacterium]